MLPVDWCDIEVGDYRNPGQSKKILARSTPDATVGALELGAPIAPLRSRPRSVSHTLFVSSPGTVEIVGFATLEGGG
jgi:hypothetical protein